MGDASEKVARDYLKTMGEFEGLDATAQIQKRRRMQEDGAALLGIERMKACVAAETPDMVATKTETAEQLAVKKCKPTAEKAATDAGGALSDSAAGGFGKTASRAAKAKGLGGKKQREARDAEFVKCGRVKTEAWHAGTEACADEAASVIVTLHKSCEEDKKCKPLKDILTDEVGKKLASKVQNEIFSGKRNCQKSDLDEEVVMNKAKLWHKRVKRAKSKTKVFSKFSLTGTDVATEQKAKDAWLKHIQTKLTAAAGAGKCTVKLSDASACEDEVCFKVKSTCTDAASRDTALAELRKKDAYKKRRLSSEHNQGRRLAAAVASAEAGVQMVITENKDVPVLTKDKDKKDPGANLGGASSLALAAMPRCLSLLAMLLLGMM